MKNPIRCIDILFTPKSIGVPKLATEEELQRETTAGETKEENPSLRKIFISNLSRD